MPTRAPRRDLQQRDNCPTVYARDDGAVVVQGYTADADDELDLPAGEAAVIIPREVLLAAAASLEASA